MTAREQWKEKRIAFIGDSITNIGCYFAFVQAALWEHWGQEAPEIIGLGVSSETVSGLSEPDHPFPRPVVFGRLDRALEQSRPQVVFACYGMNDGIYFPPSSQREKCFAEGMCRLVSAIQAYGARPVVMTPTPFDAKSRGKTIAEEDESLRYGFGEPYLSYDKALSRFAAWELEYFPQRGVPVIDLHTPLFAMIQSLRGANPDYLYNDGVHPDIPGHWEMAKTILREFFELEIAEMPCYIREQNHFYSLVMKRHQMLCAAWKEHIGHDNPNKEDALPLPQALEQEKPLRQEILARIAAGTGRSI